MTICGSAPPLADCGEAADEIQRVYPYIAELAEVPALAAQVERLATAEGRSSGGPETPRRS
jgi:hypothetical protein